MPEVDNEQVTVIGRTGHSDIGRTGARLPLNIDTDPAAFLTVAAHAHPGMGPVMSQVWPRKSATLLPQHPLERTLHDIPRNSFLLEAHGRPESARPKRVKNGLLGLGE